MGSIEPPRRRAGRSQATAAVRPIEPMKRITKPGIRSCDLRCLLAVNRKLRNIVASKLMLDWSPEQISGRLRMQYPDDESMRVSHETIYRSLFIQARGMLKKKLLDRTSAGPGPLAPFFASLLHPAATSYATSTSVPLALHFSLPHTLWESNCVWRGLSRFRCRACSRVPNGARLLQCGLKS
jgi:hypothetical protein